MPGRRGGRGGRGGGYGGSLPREVEISKKLSWLLRHGAEQEGLKLGSGGYVNLKDVVCASLFISSFESFVLYILFRYGLEDFTFIYTVLPFHALFQLMPKGSLTNRT